MNVLLLTSHSIALKNVWFVGTSLNDAVDGTVKSGESANL